MKATRLSAQRDKALRKASLFVCALLCSSPILVAGDDDGKVTLDDANKSVAGAEEEPEEYKNWIELGIGGNVINGDAAQFKQEHGLSGDVFGGIQDLHYEGDISKDTHFSVDGHAIWDNNDYDIKLELTKQGVGYIKAGFDEFRTWYDGDGGFFPPHGGTWFAPPIPEMYIDRGEAWIELGLRVPDWPEITIRYSREFRDGEKDSTIWGDTNRTGGDDFFSGPTRKVVPAYRDIDETRDIVSLDISKSFEAIKTDIDIGMRYEHNDNDDALQLERGAGQVPPAVTSSQTAQRFITQRENDNLDLYSGHIFTDTHLTDDLWFTTGYSYTTLGSDLTGSRIIGNHYNAQLDDMPPPPFQNFDEYFVDLAGAADDRQHVFDANLFWVPFKDMNVIGAFRYTRDDADANAMSLGTTVQIVKGQPVFNTALEMDDTSSYYDNFAERVELRYTHIENWLFYGEGEWEEEWGNIFEHEVIGGVDQGNLNEDTNMFRQKYTVGATWYPIARLDLAGQYYYKAVDYDNTFNSEVASPPVANSERNQRLLNQNWATNDANIRITMRPKIPKALGTLSLVSRYDYMQTSVRGKWGISPAGTGAPPTGTVLAYEDTALITQHVIGQTISWSPLARLYLQATGNYVLNQTKTPAANIDLIPNTSPTVVNFRNDYWTVTGSAGFIVDDKTDLHADYTYYNAPDYFKNSGVALPYGDDATEHTVGATLTRQLTKRVRLSIKYSYFNYKDNTYGGHNDYEAHSIFSTVQFRF